MKRRVMAGLVVLLAALVSARAELILYDDFSGAEINTDIWTVTQNPPGSKAYIDNGWVVLETYGDRRTQLETAAAFGYEHTVDMLIARPQQHIGRQMTIRYGDAAETRAYHIDWGANGIMYAYSSIGGTWATRGSSPTLDTSTTYRLRIESTVGSTTINLFQGETLLWDLTHGNPGAAGDYKLLFDNYSHNTTTDADNPLTFAINEISIIPEPGAVGLLLLGAGVAWMRRRRLRLG